MDASSQMTIFALSNAFVASFGCLVDCFASSSEKKSSSDAPLTTIDSARCIVYPGTPPHWFERCFAARPVGDIRHTGIPSPSAVFTMVDVTVVLWVTMHCSPATNSPSSASTLMQVMLAVSPVSSIDAIWVSPAPLLMQRDEQMSDIPRLISLYSAVPRFPLLSMTGRYATSMSSISRRWLSVPLTYSAIRPFQLSAASPLNALSAAPSGSPPSAASGDTP